jgi:uncharacterized delta-60 repeat protein
LGQGRLPVPPISSVDIDFYFIARLTPDGRYDVGFGNGVPGNIRSFLYFNEAAKIDAFAVASDGKLLIGGVQDASASSVFVRRLLPNGQDDSSFGTAGRIILPASVNQVSTTPKNLIVQADGKILFMGGGSFTDPSAPRYKWIVTRILPSGTIDNGFGVSGSTFIPSGRFAGAAWDAEIVQGTKILIAGDDGTAVGDLCALHQLTSTGQLDSTYSAALFVQSAERDINSISLAIQQDGKAVLGGCRGSRNFTSALPALFRFNTDGTPDETFGKRITALPPAIAPFGAEVADSHNVFVQPASVGGKIISGLNVVSRVWP